MPVRSLPVRPGNGPKRLGDKARQWAGKAGDKAEEWAEAAGNKS